MARKTNQAARSAAAAQRRNISFGREGAPPTRIETPMAGIPVSDPRFPIDSFGGLDPNARRQPPPPPLPRPLIIQDRAEVKRDEDEDPSDAQ